MPRPVRCAPSRPGGRWPNAGPGRCFAASAGDRIDATTLHPDAVRRILAHRIGMAGLSIDGFDRLSAHALRVGFIPEAYGQRFREKVEARQARAAALLGRSHACPFDLHTLLPVPAAILQLGPTHPDTRMWLAAHWGITDRLRQVVARPQPGISRQLAKNHTAIG
jgi:hypothetical protein